MEHVFRVGEAWSKWCVFHRSSIFLILNLLNTVFITLKTITCEIYVSPFVWGLYSAARMSVGAHSISLHLVFSDHKVTLTPLLFLLASFNHFRVSIIACFERDCLGVHSRCGPLLSKCMSFVLVRPAQSVDVCIDYLFFWLFTFWILYLY